MKVRLVGINEEDCYDSPKGLTAAIPEHGPEIRKRVVARLEMVGRDLFGSFQAPGEVVRGAEIGDEFTLHLERVKK